MSPFKEKHDDRQGRRFEDVLHRTVTVLSYHGTRCAECFASAGPRVVPILIEWLEDKNPRVQLFAVAALGRVGPDAKDAVPILTTLLCRQRAYNYSSYQEAAAEALGRIGMDGVSGLIEALKCSHYDERIGSLAVAALAGMDPKAVDQFENVGRAVSPALTNALERNSDWRVRRFAAAALGRIGFKDKWVMHMLEFAAESDPDVRVRKSASGALQRIQQNTQVAP